MFSFVVVVASFTPIDQHRRVNAIIFLCGRPSAKRACRWGCWSSLADGCRQAILPDRCRKPPEFWRLWAPWVPPPYRPYPAPRCQPVTCERQPPAHGLHAVRDRLLGLQGVALPVPKNLTNLTKLQTAQTNLRSRYLYL